MRTMSAPLLEGHSCYCHSTGGAFQDRNIAAADAEEMEETALMSDRIKHHSNSSSRVTRSQDTKGHFCGLAVEQEKKSIPSLKLSAPLAMIEDS